ncbi:RES domain protein [Clostridium baratii str. Sullivan]|uniref:RES domain protein n=1 Tax=Clostridium baratii str. Sullivan TaxID=1415775 RepID=A0A0A7FY35_9CLOT|nr:RES family NAD+ phosphorylase [Clostridium baratii]AIY84532.1 RES domain protein [Clostridium baratii str. Sullivan]
MRSKNEIKKLWEDFKENLKYTNRYFWGDEGKQILDILDSFEKKFKDGLPGLSPISKECNFYRARIGNFTDEEKFKGNELLAPPKGEATIGRCNADGISYLYLASNEETAIYEVKPNKGDEVTVAEIIVSDFRVFTFNIFSDEAKKYMRIFDNIDNDIEILIGIINEDLKRVVTANQKFEYLPYQWIAEYVKSKGFDAFSFGSTLTSGFNYVFFNWEDKASVGKRELKVIKGVRYDY